MPVKTKKSALTTTEVAVLGLLHWSPMSGYDLKKAIDSSIGYFWGPAKSQIYAVLPRLVAAGLATRRAVPQPHRPDKHVYRISARGRVELRNWLAEPAGDESGRLLLKIFFGAFADPEVAAGHIREWRERMESLQSELERIERTADGSREDFYPSLTRAFGLEYARALIHWTKIVERRLAEQPAVHR